MKVRTNSIYTYRPVMLDITDPPYGAPRPGDKLKVVRLHGCPPPNAMGMCHVNFVESGAFAGLVCTNSLVRE